MGADTQAHIAAAEAFGRAAALIERVLDDERDPATRLSRQPGHMLGVLMREYRHKLAGREDREALDNRMAAIWAACPLEGYPADGRGWSDGAEAAYWRGYYDEAIASFVETGEG